MHKSKVGFDQIFVKNKRKLAWREIEDELIVFYIPKEEIYRVNPTGLYIWNQIDGQKTLGEIVAGMRAEFDIGSKTELEKDMMEFMGKLIKYGIVEAK